MDDQIFVGKTALITGGSSGIGKATALLFAQQGADIGILARSKDQVDFVVDEIRADTRRNCMGLPGDVSNSGEMQKRFVEFVDRFKRLDILVNCAGINIPKGILETSLDEWREVIEINLTGTFICCKLAAEIMARQGEGNIINVSSIQAKIGGRSPQYSASKAGVEGLTKSLARELSQVNVRVNAVAPGATETGFARKYWSSQVRERLRLGTLVGRIAQPDEIANVIVFLASPAASYITGATIHVNGGAFLNQ